MTTNNLLHIKNTSESIISFPTLNLQLKPGESTSLHPSTITVIKSYLPLGIEILPDEVENIEEVVEEVIEPENVEDNSIPLNEEPIEPKKSRRGRPRKNNKQEK